MFKKLIPLSQLPLTIRWGILILLFLLFAGLLTVARLPAALLLGAILAGVFIETGGAHIRMPRIMFALAQGIIGCLVAHLITADIVHIFMERWALFLTIILLIILSNCVLGWAISRLGILPGTTAIWGLLPGAASAMMVMAEAYGADIRLVAFMQYLRVVIVALIASLIARFWVHATGIIAPIIWFPEIQTLAFGATLLLIIGGVWIGYKSKLPAGMLLVPLFLGALLQVTGLMQIELPRWLLAMSYFAIGWQIGLRFTREVLAQAMRALPQIVLSIFAIILLCCGFAFMLVKCLGIDPLTAYLATSPGGVDAVAIIASSTKVDTGFIMALQIVRVLLVLLVGPVFSRFFADRIPRPKEDSIAA